MSPLSRVAAAFSIAAFSVFVACSGEQPSEVDGSVPDGSSADASSFDAGTDVTVNADTGADVAADASSVDGAGDAVADAGCDASLTDDPRNCGACGHDCVGGACQAGACQPWTILDVPASDIASDNAKVFWVLSAPSGNVASCDRLGCDAGTTLVPAVDSPGKVAVDSTNVYYTTYVQDGGVLAACGKGGCDAGATTLSAPHVYPAWLVVDSNAIYYNVYNGDIFDCTLPSCGGLGTSITQTVVAQGLAEDANNLYWTEGYASVWTCQKSNCAGTRATIATGQTNLRAVAVHGTTVYFLQSGTGGRLLSCPKTATNCTPTVLAQNLDDPDDIEADATGVYFTVHGANAATDGALDWCPLSGCTSAPEQLVASLSYVNGIGMDDAAVYVTSSGSPIWGVAKKP